MKYVDWGFEDQDQAVCWDLIYDRGSSGDWQDYFGRAEFGDAEPTDDEVAEPTARHPWPKRNVA
ncbi:MAG: hypothetical protein NTW87_02445 [Planctomycetota bacterium]|nr:hypothetical protein [Planctomycetota bacterium]